jgi:hypothetical protein
VVLDPAVVLRCDSWQGSRRNGQSVVVSWV